MPTFTPTAEIARAAALGLDLRRRVGFGGTAVGVARARDLSNRRPVSARTVRRMVSYFARHAVDADAAGSPSRGYWADNENPSAGWIAWLLWGGDPGRRWAERQVAKIEGSMKRAKRKNPAPKRKATTRYVTKPGRGGTLYLWDVKVFPADPGDAPYHVKMWSANADLLFDRLVYDDMLAGDDWEIVGRVKQSLTDQGPKLNPGRKKPVGAKRNPAVKPLNEDAQRARIWRRLHKLHADLLAAGMTEQAKDLKNRILSMEHVYPIRPVELRKHELDFRYALRSHRYWFQGGHATGKAYPPVPTHDARRNPSVRRKTGRRTRKATR